MAIKKSWLDKLNEHKEPKIKRIDIDFADIPSGSNMFIATPKLIDAYIQEIGVGKRIDIKTLRKDLAIEHHADHTCPCLLYTSPSPRDRQKSRMPSSA